MAVRRRFTARKSARPITWETMFIHTATGEPGPAGGLVSYQQATGSTGPVYFASGEFDTDATVMRSRGSLAGLLTDPGSGASPLVSLVMGVGVATAQAVAAGGMALPNPIEDASWDGWYLY